MTHSVIHYWCLPQPGWWIIKPLIRPGNSASSSADDTHLHKSHAAIFHTLAHKNKHTPTCSHTSKVHRFWLAPQLQTRHIETLKKTFSTPWGQCICFCLLYNNTDGQITLHVGKGVKWEEWQRAEEAKQRGSYRVCVYFLPLGFMAEKK